MSQGKHNNNKKKTITFPTLIIITKQKPTMHTLKQTTKQKTKQKQKKRRKKK